MLTADRTLIRKDCPIGPEFAHTVGAGLTVYRGSIVVVFSDGTIAPAGTATPAGLTVATKCPGVAKHFQSNTTSTVKSGLYGPHHVQVEAGTWAFPFDAAPTWDKLSSPVYAIDDQTVSLTQTPSGGTARPQVGVFAGLDELGNAFVTI